MERQSPFAKTLRGFQSAIEGQIQAAESVPALHSAMLELVRVADEIKQYAEMLLEFEDDPEALAGLIGALPAKPASVIDLASRRPSTPSEPPDER